MKNLYLLYHELRPDPTRYAYVVSSAEFEEHCRLFSELRRSLDGSLRPEITFDDGHESGVRFALPILERAGLRAHFFITAGWTGTRPGFMGPAELRDLHRAGMHIGAHGWSHKLLTKCSSAELDTELRMPRERLEDILGAPVTSISLPGGRVNGDVLNACSAAGYLRIFTSIPEVNDEAAGERIIGRLNLRAGTTTEWLRSLLRPETGVLAKVQRADRLKTAAKRMMGDRLYGGLWGLVNRQEEEAEHGAPIP